jgi:hypothetical protein
MRGSGALKVLARLASERYSSRDRPRNGSQGKSPRTPGPAALPIEPRQPGKAEIGSLTALPLAGKAERYMASSVREEDDCHCAEPAEGGARRKLGESEVLGAKWRRCGQLLSSNARTPMPR